MIIRTRLPAQLLAVLSLLLLATLSLAEGDGGGDGGAGTAVALSSVVGAVASLLAGIFATFQLRKQAARISKRREKLRQSIAEIGIDLGVVKFQIADHALPSDEQLERLRNQILTTLLERHDINTVTVKALLDEELREFRTRMAKIEQRFPPEAQLEKIASINDAILSERIEQLMKQIELLESRILSKWDVAVTVSTVIGGVFAIVAATYGIISFLTNIPKP